MYLDGFLCLNWDGRQSPIARAAVLSRGALPRRVPLAVAGAWVGNRVWEDGFGNWKRGRLRHTTCRVNCLCGHTSNSVFSGVSGVRGFKLQRLGTFVGFGAGMRKGPGKTMYRPENPRLAVRGRDLRGRKTAYSCR
jgi:hypothetical protein